MDKPCLVLVTSSLGKSIGVKMWSSIIEGLNSNMVKLEGVVLPEEVDNLSYCNQRIIIVATGGTEQGIIKLAERSGSLVLIAHRYYNSLPATLEAISLISSRNSIVSVELANDESMITSIVTKTLRVYSSVQRLRKARFGLIGGISDWLVYSRVEPDYLESKLGAKLIYIPLEELIEEYRHVNLENDLLLKIVKSARSIYVDDESVRGALQIYKAIEAIIEKYSLDGLSIKCFDLIKYTGVTACLALSLLNTKGFPASCEGDIPLLISMAMGTWISNKPVFMGNIAFIDEDNIYITHCTAPLIGSYILNTHFESGLSVGVRVDYPVGEKATLYRVDPGLNKLRVISGVIVESDYTGKWCRTQIKVKTRDPRVLIKKPMGNHYALIIGDYTSELATMGKLLGLEVEEV